MDHQFRSAALGGFNRQDVLEYLEKTAAEYAQQLKQVQDQIKELTQRSVELSAREGQLAAQVATLEGEKQELSAQNGALEARAQRAEETLAQREGELARLRDELSGAKEKIAALEPDATAYATIKERATGVELEAHRRAEETVQEAQRQAKELRTQTEQWLARVVREYDELRGRIDATVCHAAGELQKAEGMLGEVSQALGRQDLALEELSRAYAATGGERVAAPVPLTED